MMADQLGMYVNGPWLSTGLRDNEINFGVTGMPAGKKDTIGVAEVIRLCRAEVHSRRSGGSRL